MSEFKFVTVLLTGGPDYNEKHVEWLQRQVKIPIYCITNSTKPMKDVITIPMQYNWLSWWCKMCLFNPAHNLGDFLYADLDTVFLQGIPEEYKKLDQTVVLSDVSRVPLDRMNSGLMYIKSEDSGEIWDSWIVDPKKHMERYAAEGDQGFLNNFLYGKARWQILFPDQIWSYKSDVVFRRRHITDKQKVIVFHGVPRYWHVRERWIPKL